MKIDLGDVAFRQKIALIIGVFVLALMVKLVFLLPEVADCNAYYEELYREKFMRFENHTQDTCVLWETDLAYTREDYIRDSKPSLNLSEFGPP